MHTHRNARIMKFLLHSMYIDYISGLREPISREKVENIKVEVDQ
jgi:hypothetical protein